MILVLLSPAFLGAQQHSSTNTGTHVVMLGTAGGPPIRLERSEPSILLLVGDHKYLLDAGYGSLRNLVAAGYHASDIDAVVITHNHLDHNGGLVDFLEYSSFEARQAPVVILGPHGTKDLVHSGIDSFQASRRIFGAESITSPDPTTIYQVKDFDEGRLLSSPSVIFDDGTITITAVENTHYILIPPGSPAYGVDRSYSFRIETPGRVLAYTGDTGPSEAVARLVQGADILFSEVVDVKPSVNLAIQATGGKASRTMIQNHMQKEHLPPEEVGRLAEAAHVKMVVLTHFSPGMDHESSTVQYTTGVSRYYHGPVIASHDLQQF